MSKDRFTDAYNQGKAAALRGDSKSKFLPSFGTREERTGFEMGYYDGLKEHALAQKEAVNVR